MENVFIVRYRRALRELQEAYRLQYALVDESDALRTLAYKQAHTVEKVILKNRKSGRGFLRSRLRECLDEEPYAWAVAQRISREVEEMEGHGYDSEVSKEEAYELYLVIEEAISGLLEVFGSQFPKMLTGAAIVTYRGNVPVSELVLKFGPKHLQRIVRQRLKAEADNPAPATTELPQLGSPAPDTPTVAPDTWAEIEALAVRMGLRKDGRFTPAGNRIAAAGAGLIDALLDAAILPNTATRPIHYANFSEHYGQPIGADRVKPTRTHWHQKARKELGLPDLKPPKLRA